MKKLCTTFSLMLNSKSEHTSLDNKSSNKYSNYFVIVIKDVLPQIEKKDNYAGYPFISGTLAFYLFLYYIFS